MTSAKMRGESGLFIVTREILPNVTGLVVVELTVRLGYAVFTYATLAFLGLVGGNITDADWGIDVAQQLRPRSSATSGGRPSSRRWHRLAGDRRQPHRRLDRQGAEVMTTNEPLPRSRRLRSHDDRPAGCALRRRSASVVHRARHRPQAVLRGVSFEVRPGEAYGLVGESGCGKSTTAYAALRYLPGNGRIDSGHVTSNGRQGAHRDVRPRAPRVPRQRGVDGLPRPGAGGQPGLEDRDSRSPSRSR